MPDTYDDTRVPGKDSGWKKIQNFKLPDLEKVNIWLTIWASPRSMGMGDAFEVPDAWRLNGKWFHVHNGKDTEIYADYVTHWRPVRTSKPGEKQ
jgi:hypothetical protein